MEDFWTAFSGWPAFGQGLFLLIILGGIFTLIHRAAFYVTVLFKGWPPEHVGQQLFNNEDDEDV